MIEFKIYDVNNKIPENRYLEMHQILIDDYVKRNGIDKYNENKEKLTNEGFNNWVNMIRNTPNYNILLYLDSNNVVGFVCFMYKDNKLILSEVQIMEEYQGKYDILRQLLKKVLELSDKTKYNIISGTINKNNNKSINVFTHIGLINTNDNWYEISYDKLLKWIKKDKN